MGRTKNLLDGLSQEEIERALYSRMTDIEYDEFIRDSKEFEDLVNDKFNEHKPRYSDAEVDNAMNYAFECIQLPPDEIGMKVYQRLFRQHFWEMLNQN